MDMEEELPTFRPFTREELATIENRIFENKLEAKKKQEQRDKNIAVRKPTKGQLISEQICDVLNFPKMPKPLKWVKLKKERHIIILISDYL